MIIDARVRLPGDLRTDLASSPAELSERYDQVLDLSNRSRQGVSELTAQLDQSGVDMALVHAEYEHGDPADELNAAVAKLTSEYPTRFLGVGTISQTPPINIMRALTQVTTCKQAGFVGISLQPAFFHTPINDPYLFPVYAKAAELGLKVFVHTGINYGTTHPFGHDHPMLLDQIACAFPGLKLIACHAGWPWTTEMVAVARKHPDVYLEFGGLAPKYIASPGTGWEVVYRFMNSLLQDQVLFGSDWPAFDVGRALDEWKSMDLKEEVREKLLGDNAARLFELVVD